MSHRWIAVLGSLVILGSLPATTGRPQVAAAASGADGQASNIPENDLAAEEYANYFGVDLEQAAREVQLSEEAGRLQADLATEIPDEFAGMWIEREPTFRVVVALTKANDSAVRARAGAFLAPYIVSRVRARSLLALQRIAASLRLPRVPHSISIDELRNAVEIDILSGGANSAQAALSPLVDAGSVRIKVITSMPQEVHSYGGLNLDSYCGGLQGTSGFSVMKNGTTTTGIMTAGHLDDCLREAGIDLPYQAGSTTLDADAQWHTTPGLTDAPYVKVTDSGLVRVLTGRRTYSNIVNGQLVCKWGRTTGGTCGTVEAKGVDPDGFFGPLNSVFVRIADCDGPTMAEPGDSGAPAFSGSIAVGIVTHKDNGDIFCSYKMLINSITHSQATLGVTVLIQ